MTVEAALWTMSTAGSPNVGDGAAYGVRIRSDSATLSTAAQPLVESGEVLQFSVRFTGQVPEATLTLSWHEPPHRKRRRQKLLEVRKPA